MADLDLEGLRYHACSSGTATPPMVREQILAACDEVDRLRLLVQRWKRLAERHDLKLREPGCKCDKEEGDSVCPVHPTVDE